MNNETRELSESDLEIGDVILFRGDSEYARAIRLVDGGRYDHVAIIVSLEPEVEMVEVNFAKGTRKKLRYYGEPILELGVRRHRTAGGGTLVAARAIELAAVTPAYAFDRLLSIALTSVTRFAHSLIALEPEEAKEFHNLLLILLEMVSAEQIFDDQATCIELTNEAFDVPLLIDDASPSAYFGLVLPLRPVDGLLYWAASTRTFVDFIVNGPTSPPSFQLDEEVSVETMRDLVTSLWHKTEKGRGQPNTIPIGPVTDDAFRQTILRATSRLLQHMGLKAPEGYEQNSEIYADFALTMLDQILRHRVIITPSDLTSTRSLYTVGVMPKIANHKPKL
jgi:hypothetical protein